MDNHYQEFELKLNIIGAKQNAAQMDTSKLLYKLELAKADNDGSEYYRQWIAVLECELKKRTP